MAELLVRVNDKINTDFYLNCQCTKRGDVIVVQGDGWAWGKEELKNPDWRIIKLPGVTVSAASVFLAPELPVDPLNPSKTLQRRIFKINLDDPSIPAAVAAVLADNKRTVPTITAAAVSFNLAALKVAKPSIADPAIIGSPTTVIG